MYEIDLSARVETYLHELCESFPDRHVGGPGNRAATELFTRIARESGFEVESTELACVDWERGEAVITSGDATFALLPGPYSLACDVTARLAVASTVDELEAGDFAGAVLLLCGELVREQLMPKGFSFFNPDSHRRIIAALEKQSPAAIISATGHNPELAGGPYPFPLIEDADFDISNAYMKDVEGENLRRLAGRTVSLRVESRRVPASAAQPIARKRGSGPGRIVLCAHIDSKDGSPGALDNGTGAAALLDCMGLLAEYGGAHTIEIVPFNGEDYYAVPGQMHYVAANEGAWDDIVLVINADGAGMAGDTTAVSFYGVEPRRREVVERAMRAEGFDAGPEWPQGDHSIFVMQGVPAVAVTSAGAFFCASTVAHTARDTLAVVDPAVVAGVARFLAAVATGLALDEGGVR